MATEKQHLQDSFWQAALQTTVPVPNQEIKVGPPAKRRTVETNNSGHSMARAVNSELAPLEDAPAPIQELIENMAGLEPFEKMQIVHDFLRKNMNYVVPEEEKLLDNKEIMDGWQEGDCDDRAQLSGVLLQYAGFTPDQLTFMGGLVSVEGSRDSGHAILMVEEEGQHYVMDINLTEVVEAKPNDNGKFYYGGMGAYGTNEGLYTRANFNPTHIFSMDKDVQGYIDVERTQKLYEQAGLGERSVDSILKL